jgi:hypothetical protein
MKLNYLTFIFFGVISCSSTLLAQKEQSDVEGVLWDLISPLAFVTTLEMQPNYSLRYNEDDQLTLITKIIQPSKSIGLPLIESKDPSKTYTVYRLEVPLVSQTLSNSEIDVKILSDLIFVDVIMSKGFDVTRGVLGQQYNFVGGDCDRPDQNNKLFQPTVTKFYKGGYFINFSSIKKLDCGNETCNVPLDINFVKTFAKNASMLFWS